MDGLTTLPEIKRLYPNVKVIILSMHNDHSMISRLMDAGASSYLTKDADSETICFTIRTCYQQGFFFNDLINKALLNGLRTKRTVGSNTPLDVQLTEKEILILRLMCDEKSTKEIADSLDLSPRTVEAIRDGLKTKTGNKSMAGLVMYAVEAGLLDTQIEETLSSISKDQMANLFKISISIISYINHDLAGQRATIFNSIDQIKEELVNKRSDNAKIDNNLNRALEATRAISSINNLIKSYSNLSRSETLEDFLKSFISSPSKIVNSIQERNKNSEIEIISSDTTLKIVYPHLILASVLTELTENAKKNTSENPKVFFKWKMKGNTFQCEIHDTGRGFKGLNENQLVPMTFLNLDHHGLGLKIIERTILDSGGHLFFSKSDLLHGAKVYFEFPVINSTSRNI